MEVFILDALRTPIGRIRGSLQSIRPDDLAALVIKKLVQRNEIDSHQIDDVIFGCVNQAGEDNRNVARMALLLAGLPERVPGVTVNRLCASSLEATTQASRAIALQDASLMIAGGVESMSRAPYAIPKREVGFATGNLVAYDTSLGWRFPNPRLAKRFPLEGMGETAENIVEEAKISREDQDAFAFSSHQKALKAQKEGLFKKEIIPVEITPRKKAPYEVIEDECPRSDTSLERLAKLPVVFRKEGSVTPGNASPLNDGASALLLASPQMTKTLGKKPLARVIASAVEGVNPRTMGLGPIPATQKVLKRAGLSVKDIDLFEINEAFAVQVLACTRALEIPLERVNVHGGAIALGHPLGASGARILSTLIYALQQRGGKYGLATMCVGVGQGMAMIIENLST